MTLYFYIEVDVVNIFCLNVFKAPLVSAKEVYTKLTIKLDFLILYSSDDMTLYKS